jgi:hypothetical protein
MSDLHDTQVADLEAQNWEDPGEAQGERRPGLLQALLLGPQAFSSVLRAPRVLLLVYLCMTLPSVLLLTSYYQSLNAALADNPLANGHGGLFLLQDYDRLHPDGAVLPGLMQLIWALMITFFAGGLLSTVGLSRKPRPGLSGFLSESGRLFFRSLRTLLPSLLFFMFWTWLFVSLLEPWVTGLAIVQVSDTRAFWVGFGLNVFYLFGIGKVLILRRIALARLVYCGRKSALVSWLWAIGYWIRHPFVTITAFLPLLVLFAAGALGAVYGLDKLLEIYFAPGSRPIYFMLAAQVFPLFYLALNLASFLLARHLVAVDTAIREGLPPEPRVVVAPHPSQAEPVESLAPESVADEPEPAEPEPDEEPQEQVAP